MRFVSLSEEDKKEMLLEIGAESVKELFRDIPQKALLKKGLGLGKGLGELELRRQLEAIAAKNKSSKQLRLFLGAGCYNHFVPAAVPAITGRSEFYTAYTPYQAEASQGFLQAMFEWQSWVCMLTGMDVANASVYDGASACAEAMLMAIAATGRKKALVARELNPEYRAVLETYAGAGGIKLEDFDGKSDDATACIIVQNPNFFGEVIELRGVAEKAHGSGALLIVAIAEALSLGFLEKPVQADIVAMETQSFGSPMSFGGPHAGVIACKQGLMRLIPGRVVGKTVDREGKEGFVLTLQAREQHIRREKAGSNICSNQALCALAATVYLATVGERGLKEIAGQNHENAAYLAEKLRQKGFEISGKNFFNEFVAKKRGARELQEKLLQKGFVLGLDLGKDRLLVAATEMNSREEIDELAGALE